MMGVTRFLRELAGTDKPSKAKNGYEYTSNAVLSTKLNLARIVFSLFQRFE